MGGQDDGDEGRGIVAHDLPRLGGLAPVGKENAAPEVAPESPCQPAAPADIQGDRIGIAREHHLDERARADLEANVGERRRKVRGIDQPKQLASRSREDTVLSVRAEDVRGIAELYRLAVPDERDVDICIPCDTYDVFLQTLAPRWQRPPWS